MAPTPAALLSCMSSNRFVFQGVHLQRPAVLGVKSWLLSFPQVIGDYVTPANEELSRDLVNKLKPYIR